MTVKKRALLGIEYVLIALAGLWGWVNPPDALIDLTNVMFTQIWALYMMVGGAIALSGILFDKWFGEYAAIHLVGSALTLYVVALFADSREEPFKAVGALLLIALMVELVLRVIEVNESVRVATRAAYLRE